MLCNLICRHPPDKTRQLSRHGYNGDVPLRSVFQRHPIIPAAQALIRPVRIGNHLWRVPFLPFLQFL